MARSAVVGEMAAYDTLSPDILGAARYCALLWTSESVVEPPWGHSSQAL
jgi:hypothetical protein